MGNAGAKRIDAIFDYLDEDKCGYVTKQDLEEWVKDEQFMDNPEFKGETVRDLSKALLAQMDVNGDGQVSRDELTAYFKKLSNEEVEALTSSLNVQHRSQALRNVFNAIDQNKSGDVSKEELIAWMTHEHHWKEKKETSDADREAVWKQMEKGGAKIVFSEFEAFFKAWSVRQIREATEVVLAHAKADEVKKANERELLNVYATNEIARAAASPKQRDDQAKAAASPTGNQHGRELLLEAARAQGVDASKIIGST